MNTIPTTLVPGHQVASGENRDPRFPGGTIRMQVPHFRERGLDLTAWHPATLNLSLLPGGYRLIRADHTFREVKWHPTEPAEDFSFFACEVCPETTSTRYRGWIYFPHPETKPEHFQPADLLEVLVERRIAGLAYGSRIELWAKPDRVVFETSEKPQQG